MGELDRRINEFRDFLTNASHNKGELEKNLYIMTGIIETYYEFISRVLDGRTKQKYLQEKQLKIIRDSKVINAQQYSIMDETRRLRNKLLHDLMYSPTADEIIKFHTDCEFHKKPSFLAPEQLENQFTNSVVNGYCIIEGQLGTKIYEKIGEIQTIT